MGMTAQERKEQLLAGLDEMEDGMLRVGAFWMKIEYHPVFFIDVDFYATKMADIDFRPIYEAITELRELIINIDATKTDSPWGFP